MCNWSKMIGHYLISSGEFIEYVAPSHEGDQNGLLIIKTTCKYSLSVFSLQNFAPIYGEVICAAELRSTPDQFRLSKVAVFPGTSIDDELN